MKNVSPSQPLSQREFSHILLWMPNWIGDVILAMPTFQSLRERYPNARITAVVRSSAEELLRTHPDIDSVIRISYAEADSIFDKIDFGRDLKKYGFDLAVVFPNSFRSAFMTALTGAKVRLGYAVNGRGWLLTHPMPATPERVASHRTRYYFDILSPLGLKEMKTRFRDVVPPEVDGFADRRLRESGFEEGEPFIAVHPGSSKPERGWHINRFGMLCQRLIKERGVKIVLLGGKADAEALEEISRVCPPGSVRPIADLGLHATAAMIRKSVLFIGNDSGIMHLAAMVDTPIIGIFGPGHPAATGPFISPGRREIITRDYPCSPCRQRFFRECKPSPHNKPYCLEDISVNDVAAVAIIMLEQIKAGML